ncbi:MAG: hypothetical protein K8S15_07985 [Candidatus Aegiribacteria sp.]|nr:hypothetical protein [Candidatus Aegiribacteria sp.]
MKTAILSLIVISAASFSTVLVSDDFNDGNADGWFEFPTGASYTVEAGRYCFTHTAPDTVWADSWISDIVGGMSVSDYSCRVNLMANEGEMFGIVGRGNFTMVQGYGLLIIIDETDKYLVIIKIEGIAQGQLLGVMPVSFSYGQEYWLRLEMNGNLIGGKYWTGNAGDEPVVWNLTVTDNSYQDPGVFALFGYDSNTGGSASMDVSFDDVEITDETTLDLKSSSWAFVKSLF